MLSQEQAEQAAKLIVIASWRLYQNQTSLPKKPSIGTWVVEYSTLRKPPYLDKVGKLLSITDGVYELETLTGAILNWENAAFIPVATEFTTN